jgi:hypothetical protein
LDSPLISGSQGPAVSLLDKGEPISSCPEKKQVCGGDEGEGKNSPPQRLLAELLSHPSSLASSSNQKFIRSASVSLPHLQESPEDQRGFSQGPEAPVLVRESGGPCYRALGQLSCLSSGLGAPSPMGTASMVLQGERQDAKGLAIISPSARQQAGAAVAAALPTTRKARRAVLPPPQGGAQLGKGRGGSSQGMVGAWWWGVPRLGLQRKLAAHTPARPGTG